MSTHVEQINASPEQIKAAFAAPAPLDIAAELERSAAEPEPEPEPEDPGVLRDELEQRLAEHPEWGSALPYPSPTSLVEYGKNLATLSGVEAQQQAAAEYARHALATGEEDPADVANQLLGQGEVLERFLGDWYQQDPAGASAWIGGTYPQVAQQFQAVQQFQALQAYEHANADAEEVIERFRERHPDVDSVRQRQADGTAKASGVGLWGLMGYIAEGGLSEVMAPDEYERVAIALDAAEGDEERLELLYRAARETIHAYGRQSFAQSILGAGTPNLKDGLGLEDYYGPEQSARLRVRAEAIVGPRSVLDGEGRIKGTYFDRQPDSIHAELERLRRESPALKEAARADHERVYYGKG